MKLILTDQMKDGFNTAYIDKTYSSNLAYKPQFISNNYKEGEKNPKKKKGKSSKRIETSKYSA